MLCSFNVQMPWIGVVGDRETIFLQDFSREAEMPNSLPMLTLSAARIASELNSQVLGNGDLCVSGVEFIKRATATDLAFISSEKYIAAVAETAASVIIIPQSVADRLSAESLSKALIPVAEPEAAFLSIAELLHPEPPRRRLGISAQASVSESAMIGTNSNIHPFAVVGDRVVIGEDCEIGPGVVLGEGCILGDNVRIDANTVLYRDVVVGNDVIIHANSVIGADGFGYRTVDGQHRRLPHVGRVRICDNVEIGAGVTVDRAKMGETVIGTGTKIDNQVVIAHNCQVGPHNLLCSQTGIAGSSSTGSYVVCAGQAGIADHVHLGDGAIIGAKAGVHRDMPGGQAYLGSPARNAAEHTREVMVIKRLPEMRSTLKDLVKQVAMLQLEVDRLTTGRTVESDEREAA